MKEVKKLIDLGKEKGYLTYDDVNDMLPAELASEVARLALETEDLTDAVCGKVAADCLARLKGKHIKAQKRDERLKIRVAE